MLCNSNDKQISKKNGDKLVCASLKTKKNHGIEPMQNAHTNQILVYTLSRHPRFRCV